MRRGLKGHGVTTDDHPQLRKVGMKRAALFYLVVSVGMGCGSDKEARKNAEGGAEFAVKQRPRPRQRQPAEPPPAMQMDNEVGVLDGRDVEEALEAHFAEVRGCYQRAGKAQRYAGGKVLLRFLVAGDGRAQDVLVIESSLGNYDVERCLVEVGRRIVFNAPLGGKATTFEYPVEFRSTNQIVVLDLDGPKVERDVAAFLPQLASCGQLTADAAMAIIYIEPNGFPGSVGLAAGSALDEDVGDCMVQTIRRWRMSATLPGRVLRANFAIPPVIATASAEGAAPSSSRRAASSASGRRRHR
jgi:TonB family protein